MANPTNSVDIYDKDFATTHALLLTEKQDKAGREATAAQSQTVAGEKIGNFYDDNILALRDQGFLPVRYTDATGDATPSPQAIRNVPDGGAMMVEIRGWGKKAANDMVFREIRRRYERSGATILTDTDYDSGNLYSAGGTLTTAAIDLVLSGAEVRAQVTGEATTITWHLYIKFLEAHTP